MTDLKVLAAAISVAEQELAATGVDGKIVVAVDNETFQKIKDSPDRTFMSTGRVRLECVVSDVTFRV